MMSKSFEQTFGLLKKPEEKHVRAVRVVETKVSVVAQKLKELQSLDVDLTLLTNTVSNLKRSLADLTLKVHEAAESDFNVENLKTLIVDTTKIHQVLLSHVEKEAELQQKEEKLLDYLLKQFEATM